MRKAISLAGVLVLAWAGPLVASGEAPAEPTPPEPTQAEIQRQMCEITVCQRDVHVAIRRKDGSLFEKTYDVLPGIVQKGGITLMPGQSVHVEVKVSGDEVELLRVVDTITDPANTLTLSFAQMDDGGMMLTTTSRLPRPLKFDMGIMSLDDDTLYKTSSCPITSTSFEMWPDPIFLVFLGRPRLLPEGPRVCD